MSNFLYGRRGSRWVLPAMLVLFWGLGVQLLADHVQYLNGIGSGVAGTTRFRTQLELTNESPERAVGALTFFGIDGTSYREEIVVSWIGVEGEAVHSGNRIEFSLPSRTLLLMEFRPILNGGLGWARLRSNVPVVANCSLQVADTSRKKPWVPEDFEHYIVHQAEIHPTQGFKRFSFPIWFFTGAEEINTAFSVSNISGAAGEVTLRLRSADQTRTIRLEPSEAMAGYYTSFWHLAFPEMFPFQIRDVVEVVSEVPLGVTVFRTLRGIPVSGIQPAGIEQDVECFEGVLDTPFNLTVNQCSSFEDLTVSFWGIAEDSRCPTDVECVWEGRVVVEIQVLQQEGRSRIVSLSPTDGENRFESNRYVVELLEVDPLPVSTQQLEVSDYRLELVVTENGQSITETSRSPDRLD